MHKNSITKSFKNGEIYNGTLDIVAVVSVIFPVCSTRISQT